MRCFFGKADEKDKPASAHGWAESRSAKRAPLARADDRHGEAMGRERPRPHAHGDSIHKSIRFTISNTQPIRSATIRVRAAARPGITRSGARERWRTMKAGDWRQAEIGRRTELRRARAAWRRARAS